MGTSFTSFRNQEFWTSDGLLEVWLYLLVREIDKYPDPNSWLMNLRDHWLFEATHGGSGIVYPRLDDYLREDKQVALVATFSQQALEWLEEQGATLSKEMLNEWDLGGDSYFTKDVETELFAKVGQTFVQLLHGALKTDPSSTIV